MKPLLALLLAATLVPTATHAASYRFNDEVRAGRTLSVSVPTGSPTVLALMPDGFDDFTQPLASATTFNVKPGKRLRLKVPKATKPGDYVLVAYDERPGDQTCRNRRCAAVRRNLDELGTIEVVKGKPKK